MAADEGVATTRDGGREWLRGTCSINGDMISLDTDTAETYRPMEQVGLVFDLANLRSVDDVPDFVERRGLLWHGTPGEGVVAESWIDWQREVGSVYRTVRTADLIRSAARGDDDALEQLRLMLPDDLPEAIWEDDERERLLRFGSVAVARVVDEGLRHVRLGIDADVWLNWDSGQPGVWLLSPRPADLLGYAYGELVELLMNKVPVQSCDECGRVYHVTHHRQRFCDERCAQRNRYRRWSERQKAKKGKD